MSSPSSSTLSPAETLLSSPPSSVSSESPRTPAPRRSAGNIAITSYKLQDATGTYQSPPRKEALHNRDRFIFPEDGPDFPKMYEVSYYNILGLAESPLTTEEDIRRAYADLLSSHEALFMSEKYKTWLKQILTMLLHSRNNYDAGRRTQAIIEEKLELQTFYAKRAEQNKRLRQRRIGAQWNDTTEANNNPTTPHHTPIHNHFVFKRNIDKQPPAPKKRGVRREEELQAKIEKMKEQNKMEREKRDQLRIHEWNAGVKIIGNVGNGHGHPEPEAEVEWENPLEMYMAGFDSPRRGERLSVVLENLGDWEDEDGDGEVEEAEEMEMVQGVEILRAVEGEIEMEMKGEAEKEEVEVEERVEERVEEKKEEDKEIWESEFDSDDGLAVFLYSFLLGTATFGLFGFF